MPSVLVRLSRTLGVLCLVLIGLAIIATPQQQSVTAPLATAQLIAGAAIKALAVCNGPLDSPVGRKPNEALVVYAIGQQRNNRTHLHSYDPNTRRLLGVALPRSSGAPALVELQFLADANGLALSKDCRKGYTVGLSDGTVYELALPDPNERVAANVKATQAKVVQACPAGGAEDLALWEAAGKVYVACRSTDEVAVVNLATKAVEARVAAGDGPIAMGLYAAGGSANWSYTADFFGSTNTFVGGNNTASIANKDAGCDGASNVAADAQNPAGVLNVYATCRLSDTVAILAPENGKSRVLVSVCDDPLEAALDPKGQGAFVACSGVDDGRSGVSFVALNNTTKYSRTAQLLDRYTAMVCASENAKCDVRYELWVNNTAARGEIVIYDANALR